MNYKLYERRNDNDLYQYRKAETDALLEVGESEAAHLEKMIDKLDIPKKKREELKLRIAYQEAICSRIGYLYGIRAVKEVPGCEFSFKAYKEKYKEDETPGII